MVPQSLRFPAKDTVKRSLVNLSIEETVPRETVWLAQTPQIFEKNILLKAYSKIFSPQITDDSNAVENIGEKVKLVPGSYSNFKITVPQDLRIAEFLLKARK